MSLPTPYWLLPNANRGLASTLDDLPIKRDFILLSTADHDETGLYLAAWNAANPADESQDVAQPTDLTTWSMAFWKEVGGVLQPLLTITQTPTVNGSFLQVSDGVVRRVVRKADRVGWPTDVYYVLGYVDQVPRDRAVLAGMFQFPDLLRTVAA